MRYVVTGAAGFIGAHLSQQLLDQGHEVVGIDALTDYYDVAIKRARLRGLTMHPAFSVIVDDMETLDLSSVVDGCDGVLHLAGQPGVRLSWDRHFDLYLRRNLLASQRLLEAARTAGGPRVVVASSSSVYGNAAAYPTSEDSPTRPFSPYGVTKLAMEHLCWSYAENWGVDVVALRYFTVYGPGQRPDMGLHKFIRKTLDHKPITVFGDGNQIRDFTYVSDIVAATIAAVRLSLPPATVINVAGGAQTTVNDLLALVGEHTGVQPRVLHEPSQPGDVRVTGGAIEKAQRLLGWTPEVSLSDGVKAHVAAMAADRPEPGPPDGAWLPGTP